MPPADRIDFGGGIVGGFTDRSLTAKRPPWDGNLALHVGDDPQAVALTRDTLRAAIGSRSLWFSAQVHGREVAIVDQPGSGVTEVKGEADAMVTALAQVALAVMVADCIPVLLADPRAGVIAVAHAGRPGLVAGVLSSVCSSMLALGARQDACTAILGPSICGGCYEVPEQMRDDVELRLPGSATTTRAGTPGLDLAAGARRQLESLGLTVLTDGRCTAETPELYSYRRDPRTGRFAGWITRQ